MPKALKVAPVAAKVSGSPHKTNSSARRTSCSEAVLNTVTAPVVTSVVPTPVTAEGEKAPVRINGLRRLIAYDREIKALTAKRVAELTKLMPDFYALHVANAKGVAALKDLTKTLAVVDTGTTANVQLRSASAAPLKLADIQTLSKAGLALKSVEARSIINPKYAGDCKPEDYKDVKAVLVKLATLIAMNPDFGVPADFFGSVPSISLPEEDALLQALQLEGEGRQPVLNILSGITVLAGKIDDETFATALVEVDEPVVAVPTPAVTSTAEIIDFKRSKAGTKARPAAPTEARVTAPVKKAARAK